MSGMDWASCREPVLCEPSPARQQRSTCFHHDDDSVPCLCRSGARHGRRLLGALIAWCRRHTARVSDSAAYRATPCARTSNRLGNVPARGRTCSSRWRRTRVPSSSVILAVAFLVGSRHRGAIVLVVTGQTVAHARSDDGTKSTPAIDLWSGQHRRWAPYWVDCSKHARSPHNAGGRRHRNSDTSDLDCVLPDRAAPKMRTRRRHDWTRSSHSASP